MNELQESGRPYDIEIELLPVDGSTDSLLVYIEVKSTISNNKDLISFSWNELKFAAEKKHSYHLYRVYNAGQTSHRICQVENFNQYLQGRCISILL